MKPADLVFLVAALGVVVALVRLIVLVAGRRPRDARRLGVRLVGFVVAYLSVVVAVSLATPRRWVTLGEEQRFDDWCVAVQDARRDGDRYRLTIRVANRGRGRPQRAADASLLLVAEDGRRFEPLEAPAERSLRSVVAAGESFETVREFAVPVDASVLGVDVVHGAWPEWFIVGDRGSLFHRRPLVRVGDPR